MNLSISCLPISGFTLKACQSFTASTASVIILSVAFWAKHIISYENHTIFLGRLCLILLST